MMKKTGSENEHFRFYALIVIVVMQLGIIVYQYSLSQYPRWIGEAVVLKTRPLDPRSLFRGNYAQLQYDISRLPLSIEGKKSARICPGDELYVPLEQVGEVWTSSSAQLVRPSSGLFIRGNAESKKCSTLNNRSSLSIRYGIEAYFAPKKKALALERRRARGMNVKLFIAPDGRASLDSILDVEL